LIENPNITAEIAKKIKDEASKEVL